MLYTDTLSLKLPQYTDPADIADINYNMLILDKAAIIDNNINITGRWAFSSITNTGLNILDTDGSNTLGIVPGENLTTNRTLSIIVGDSNRTLTLNGNLTVGGNVSFTNGVLQMSNGGTSANLTASNGGIVYSTDTSLSVLAGTNTANKVLMSGASAAPSWSTPTYPNTATAGKILIGNGTDIVLTTAGYPSQAGTSGNVLMSDGTNIVSQPQSNISHSSLSNLSNNDHTQYVNAVGGAPLTLTSQSITFNYDTADFQLSGNNLQVKDSGIDHNSLYNYSSNRHIDHTAVSISAGTGLSGGGTIDQNRTISLSHLGIESLSDPNADRIMFWDDSESAVKWLTVGTGLTITDTTITATGTTDHSALSNLDYAHAGHTGFEPTISVLELSRGGTGKGLTAANGGIVYTDADSMEILSPTATANKVLMSGASAAPSWSTPTYPNTATSGKILIGNGTDIVLTTAGYPSQAGTSGNVLMSDGTNIVSQSQDNISHSLLSNLSNNDHTQYVNAVGGAPLTLTSQSITFNYDTADFQLSGNNLQVKDSGIDHNSLYNYSSNRHIDHTAVSISAGTGLSGGGTIDVDRTISLSHLGIESLSDPNADRIMFWDDSESAVKWLTVGTGLTIIDTTITATGATDHSALSNLDYAHAGHTGFEPTISVLELSRGGTGKGLTAANGGIVYTDADSMEILSPTTTANKVLMSGASAAPSWSTATYPNTAGSSGNVIVSNGTNFESVAQSNIDHGSVGGLSDDDHTQYLLANGTRSLTGNWDVGDGRTISTEKISARDSDGLTLTEDGGKGILIQDNTGYVGINKSNPSYQLDVNGDIYTTGKVYLGADWKKALTASEGTKEIYVATTGSDETGDGSASKPYKTISKAVSVLPRCITEHTYINISPGTYNLGTDGYVDTIGIDVWASLTFRAKNTDGYELYPSSPLQANIYSSNTIGNSSLSLQPNSLVDGKVWIMNGTGAGQYRTIVSNTATTITVGTAWDTTPDSTSYFLYCGGVNIQGSSDLMRLISGEISLFGVILKSTGGYAVCAYSAPACHIWFCFFNECRRSIITARYNILDFRYNYLLQPNDSLSGLIVQSFANVYIYGSIFNGQSTSYNTAGIYCSLPGMLVFPPSGTSIKATFTNLRYGVYAPDFDVIINKDVNVTFTNVTTPYYMGKGDFRTALISDDSSNAILEIKNNSSTSDYDQQIKFTKASTTSFSIGVDDSDSDKFKISAGSALGTNDRLVIDTAGNVGIGTTTPGYTIDVSGSARITGTLVLGSGTGVLKVSSGTVSVSSSIDIDNIGITIDGAGSVITTGSKGYRTVDYNCTILGWTILADQVGSCVIDVRKCTYDAFPSTTSISGSEKPTLSSAQKNRDMELNTWTTSISAGDILEFVVNSASTVTRVTVLLKVRVS